MFLLDIVPPSPYHIHTRSLSSDRHRTVSNRDAVVSLPPQPLPPPGLARDRASAAAMLGDSTAPSLPARCPMTPQSVPPHFPSVSTSSPSSVNAAATFHDRAGRVDSSSRRVHRLSAGQRAPTAQNLSVYATATNNGTSRSPAIPRRRDFDVDEARRSSTGPGRRPCENEYVPIHPPPLPPPPTLSQSVAGASGHQNSSVLVDETVSHRATLCGSLSLSVGELNVSPPVPHLMPNQVRSVLC